MKKSLFATLMVASLAISYAPNGFALGAIECSRASSTAERILCNDESLTGFDDELVENYQAAYRNIGDRELRSMLNQFHTQWRNELNKCTDEYCVADALYFRLDLLCDHPDFSKVTPLCIETEEFLSMDPNDIYDEDIGDDDE